MRPEEVPFARLAIETARMSVQEPGRIPLYVGAVAAENGESIGTAYRCEDDLGEHAEFTLLEHKLAGRSLAAVTIFTTLEPCTLRSPDKTPCAQRLIDRGVARVVIGILDPNTDIRGLGYHALRGAGIAVEFFDEPLVTELEELNREFMRIQRAGIAPPRPTPEFLEAAQRRSLDDWYVSLNSVYFHRNFDRRPSDVSLHLMEVVGALSLLASNKVKPGIDRERQVSKALGGSR